MSDILERLAARKLVQNIPPFYMVDVPDPDCHEAADEITKLRAEVDAKQASYQDVSDRNQDLASENKRLRAELAEAEGVIKPFADEGKGLTANYDWARDGLKLDPDMNLTHGDLRKAAAWLEGRKG